MLLTVMKARTDRHQGKVLGPRRSVSATGLCRAGRSTRALVRLGIKYRKRLAPLYATAGLTGLGGVLAASRGGAPTAAVLSAAGAAALAWRLRRRAARKRAATPRVLLWYLATTGGAAALLMTMALIGPLTPPVPGLTLLWFLAVAGPYWWRRRIRPIAPLQETERAQVWAERIAAQGKALPGSVLAEVQDLVNGYGWKATVELPAGDLTAEQAIGAAARVASAYRVPLASVVIERMPDGAEDHAALTVYTVNPLQRVHPWPGPQVLNETTGVAQIGVYADGTPVRYRFWRAGSGPVHDLISGDTDSGKSRLLDALLATEKHAALIHSWVIDPQGGQSLPDWQDDVGWFADSVEEGLLLLMAAVRIMYQRSAVLSRTEWTDEYGTTRRGFKGFTPGLLGMPLLSITIDEAHAVLRNPIAVLLCQEIGKMGRKCGIRLRLVTQMPLLDQLGNSHVLRAQVAAGNVIVLRTSMAISGQVAFQSAFPVYPHKLPREWGDGSSTSGLGYALGPSARPSVMRTLFLADPLRWARSGTETTLEQSAVTAAGKPFATWRRRREERWQMPVDAPAFALEDGDESGGPVLPQTPAGQEAAARAGTCKQAILDHLIGLNGAFAYTGAIARALDVPLQTASSALARLADEGAVTKVARGTWVVEHSAHDEAEDETASAA
ncbi:hypothetical protein [Streptomyces monomycini]|uniref:hypothetical protein n=1 Tax=Streptomyces monomycini TaxID=371720 RepID=UPI001EEADDF4|nr:hypothetical protein [Streptomyces monomycini]